jgi:hypothetical protein
LEKRQAQQCQRDEQQATYPGPTFRVTIGPNLISLHLPPCSSLIFAISHLNDLGDRKIFTYDLRVTPARNLRCKLATSCMISKSRFKLQAFNVRSTFNVQAFKSHWRHLRDVTTTTFTLPTQTLTIGPPFVFKPVLLLVVGGVTQKIQCVRFNPFFFLSRALSCGQPLHLEPV